MVDGLAPWPKNFRPTPGQFGAMFQTLSVALATAGPALVGTASTTIAIGVPASKTIYVTGASIQGRVVYTSSGTVTATLQRKAAGGNTALTGAKDLTAALSTDGYANVPITETDANATLAPGNTLEVVFGASGLFGPTATADLRMVVEIAVIG